MSDFRPEHIITIVVRMRNEIAKVANEVASQVQKTTTAQERSTASTQRATKAGKDHAAVERDRASAIRETVDGYQKLNRELRYNESPTQKQIYQLSQYRKELDRLAKAEKPGSETGSQLNALARQAEQRLAIEKQINQTRKAESERAAGEMVKIEEEAQRELEKVRAEADRKEAERQERRNTAGARIAEIRRQERDRRTAEAKALAEEITSGIDEALAELEREKVDRAKYNKVLSSSRGSGPGYTNYERARVEDAKASSAEQIKAIQEVDRVEQQMSDRRVNRARQEVDEIQKLADRRDAYLENAQLTGVPDRERMTALRQYQSEAQRITRGYVRRDGPGSERALAGAAEVDRTSAAIDHMRQRIRLAGHDTDIFQNAFSKLFRRTPEQISDINNRVEAFNRTVTRSHFAVAKFDNILRGLVVAGAVVFFQQLIGVVVALGGALVSLAASASQAAGALVGILAAGAAQAGLVLAPLVASFKRVGAVFDVLKAQQKANTVASRDNANALDKQRSAAEAVADAQRGLADANDRVREAQEALTKARKDAVREIEDLMAAERRAELQARQANLAREDAQRALRLSRSSGDVDQTRQNELELQSANLSVGEAITGRRRARQAADYARSTGVAGTAGVIAATKALRDAEKAVGDASRQIQRAKESAGEASDKLSTAEQNVKDLLAQLSPAERRLYQTLERVQERYKQAFTGQGGVLEPIILAFDHGAQRILDLLNDNRIIKAARDLSDEIATQLNRVFDGLSSEDNRNFLVFMASEARKNLPSVVTLLTHVGRLLRSISVAAAPAFTEFLNFLVQASKAADESTSTEGGFTKLQKFFLNGERYAESILKLGYAIAQLFGAIIGVSADEGGNAFDKMTAKVQQWTRYIHENQKEVNDFFKSAIRASGFVLNAFGKVLVVMLEMFNEDQVRLFSEGFSEILLPALASVAQMMGLITHWLLEISTFKVAGIPIFGEILKLAITVGIFMKLIGPLIRGISYLSVALGRLGGSRGMIAFGTFLATIAGRNIILALTVITAAITLLGQKFDWLGKNIDKVILALTGLGFLLLRSGGLVPAMAKLGTLFSGFGLGGLGTRLGRVAAAFGKILAPVTDLISKLPILSRLLGAGAVGAVTGGAVAGEVAGAATAARVAVPVVAAGGGLAAYATAKHGASAAASLAGKEATAGVARFAGFLKTSIISSIALAVGVGIYRGFKNKSVSDGIRDFASTLTFGLIKSVSSVSKGLQEQLAKDITPQAIKTKTPEQLLGSRPVNERFITSANSFVPVKTYDEGNPLLAKLQERYGGKKAGELKASIAGLLTSLNALNRADSTISTKVGFDSFIQRAREFRNSAPKELTDALNVLIQSAKDGRKKLLDELNKPITINAQRAKMIIDFGTKLQAPKVDTKALTESFFNDLKELPPYARKKAKDSALEMVDQLEKGGKITKRAASEMRDGITDRWKEIRDRSAKRAEQTKNRTARQIDAMAAYITSGMADAVTATNVFLDALGVKKIKMPDGSTKKTLLGIPIASTPGDTTDDATRATGGWIGKAGERGRDTVRTWLGRGEAVLNWAQQRAVNAAMAGRDTLDGIFSRVKGEHAGPVDSRSSTYARGGYVQQAAANGGGTYLTSAARDFAERMFKRGFNVTSAYRPGSITSSGRPSQHGSGSALDFGDSVNDLGKLWRILFPIRGQFNQLLGPQGLYNGKQRFQDATLQADHNDHIHVGFLGKVQASLGRISSSVEDSIKKAFKRLKTPDYGTGPLAEFAEALNRKVVRAGNKKMAEASAGDDSTGSAGSIPSFSGPWVRVMKKIAKDRSWNLSDWKKLVQGESGGNPRAVNPSSGAFGLGQFLGATKDAYAKYGATSTDGAKQIRAMAQYILDRYGNPSNAYRTWLARSPHWYSSGGAVVGHGTGTSDSIVARLSNGEHVLTAKEVARAGGHQAIYAMRRMLGGGVQSQGGKYKDGGSVTASQKSFNAPDTLSFTIEGILGESQAITKYLKGLRSKSSNFLKNYRRAFSELFSETDGIITRFTEAMTKLASDQTSALTRATFKITKSGAVIKRLSDTAIAGRQVDDLTEALRALIGEKGELNKALSTTTVRLRNIRKGGISKSERKTYDELKGYQKKLRDGIKAIDDQIGTNLQARYEAVENMIQSFADKANNAADAANAGLGLRQRMQALTGNATPTANAQAQAGILSDQIRGLTLARNIATNQKHGDTAAALQRQIDDLQVQISEALAAGIQGEVDQITKRAGNREAMIGLRERIASVLGRTGDIAGIINDRIANVSTEISDLNGQLADAQSKGFGDLASTIQAQIDDLNTSITEMTAQRLSNAIDLVNSTADRAQAAQAIRSRYADLKEKIGNFEGAFSDRSNILSSQLSIIGNQRNALYGLLDQAQQQGNQGQVEALTAQIEDLNAQMAENTQAQHENTVGLRQARIDAITSRGGFLGGVYGGLGNILGGLGQLTGQTDTAGQKGLLEQSGQVLGQVGDSLRGQLASIFGIDLRGLDPAALVQRLSSLNYDQIETNMAPDDKAQFEALINAIIENASAVVDNTDQIKKATDPQTQDWSSTSWQWFRNAVFNGNGGLLPRYTNPSLGITNTVSGFTTEMNPASYSGIAGGTVGGGDTTYETNVIVTEQVEDANPEVIAARIYQRWRRMPKSR